jgi:hypothetical protein
MKNDIDDLEGPPDDEAVRRDGPANPEDPKSAVEPKRAVSVSEPAPEQPKRKTKTGAAARKRRKRFVL